MDGDPVERALVVRRLEDVCAAAVPARDRPGLIRDIATVVSEVGVNMTSVSSNVGAGKELVIISATLEVESLDQMQRVFARLEKVKDVRAVERDLGKIKRK